MPFGFSLYTENKHKDKTNSNEKHASIIYGIIFHNKKLFLHIKVARLKLVICQILTNWPLSVIEYSH